jgi:uncharacterized SAM-binding protein YcdF (DUF218 family)
MDGFSLRWAIEMLVLPPGGPLLLAMLGLVLGWRRRQSSLAFGLLALGVCLSWVFAMPAVANILCREAEGDNQRPITEEQLRQAARGPGAAGAIVVLGGGIKKSPREGPERFYPNQRTLERLAQGAWVARTTGLPLLLSGGAGSQRSDSEALVMSRALERSFALKPRWREEHSPDTSGNARESAAMLREAGIRKVILVTHAYHMRRARAAFQAAGLDVVAAPHGFRSGGEIGLLDFIPSSSAMESSWLALHESLGMLWYRWTDRI